MALTSGTRLGPYEIVAPIGAGGMGEVYRAKDTRLERTVAIKVLPGHLAHSPELRQRLEREARAVSSLSHPHICTLHDIGHQDGIDYLVMEYLEGETLAARLAKGLLPLEQVLRCATEIADALAQAHRQGVFHRDLKPGNIMLTKSGAKLLDFGLAKLREAGPAGDVSALPTVAADLTQKGTILGTFQYMAPEQLESKETDARSDIFSFGAVLYEMVTGRKAFQGQSQASVISAIMDRDPPPVSSLQPAAPPALDRAIRRCLAKDPDERWQTARDLMLELEWVAEGSEQAERQTGEEASRRGARRERLVWRAATAILTLVSVVALAALAWVGGWFRPRAIEVGVARFLLAPPDGTAIAPGPFSPQITVSPDGRKLAFAAVDGSGKSSLWVRPLDSFSAQRLDKTEDATLPFWSPDSQFVAFFADGKLRRIAVSGGSPQTICDARNGQGGAWNRDGVIVFAPTWMEALYRVPAAGGVATPVTALDKAQGEIAHAWPQFLPDGRHFLYLIKGKNSGIYVQSLGSQEKQLLLKNEMRAAYVGAGPGYLLFMRDTTLMAQEFDAGGFRLRGEPVSVAEDVNSLAGAGRAAFSVSENGVLVYRGGGGAATTQLVWYNREGKRLASVGEPGQYAQITLSPDEKRLTVERTVGRDPTSDLWLVELSSGIFSRLTFDPHAYEADAIWSPDSRRIVFSINQSGKNELYEMVVGSGQANVLYADDKYKAPEDWSRDGRFIIYHDQPGNIVSVLPLSGERKPQVVLQTPFRKDEFHFAPGPQGAPEGAPRWVAYGSQESGRWEVYVAAFPSFTEKRQVSTGGGGQPLWRKDGKELFYLGLDGKLMAVDVKAGSTLETGIPKALFQTGLNVFPQLDQYCVTGDGRRFLVNEPLKATGEQISVVLHWPADLRR